MSDGRPSRSAHVQLLAVSWNLGWPVAAGVMAGYWIDERIGTSPAVTLIFGIGAMAASVWRMIDLSRREAAERTEDDAGADGGEP